MANIKRSLIGKEAHGVLAKNLLLRTYGKRIIVGALTSSTNPRTPAQIAHRSIFQGGIEYWHTLTDEEKAAYTAINPKVGYNPAYLNFMGTWLMGTVPAHKTQHESGGTDQVSVAGLSGLLADQQVSFRLRTGLDADKPAAGNTEGDVWWGTDTDKLYLWDGAAWAEVGAGAAGATAAFPDTQVYNTNAPNAWTDLDLSAVTGSNAALVLLKLKNTQVNDKDYYLRTNGETSEIGFSPSRASGTTVANIGENYVAYFVLITDAAGKIEWKSNGTNVTEVRVLGYVKA